ncbi:MAG: CmcJ/NvfI family oxidoreductase [Hyphomicrobiaceae bacterium]
MSQTASQAQSRSTIEQQTVEGVLTFIVPQSDKPAFHSAALTGGEPKVLFKTEERPVTITDMRPFAGALSIDKEGFELLKVPTDIKDFYDDAVIEDRYFEEIKKILRNRFNANEVVIFDATRRSDGGHGAENPDGKRGPARRVHVDYTANSGPQRVVDILGPGPAERLRDKRARIIQINVWRPIRGPVKRAPLALADAASVGKSELVATDQVFPDRVGEIYHLAYAPTQKWYFAPEMDVDEVLLIKGWDSLGDGRAQYTPHGAFDLADTTSETPPRESIEVRTLVFVE